MNHIVIVEDDESISEMLQYNLHMHGYETTHFLDGEEARKYLEEASQGSESHPVDLVILDIMLPGCNGLDVCKSVRQRNPVLPILMLTALSGEADRVIGLELGADDYLTKPFSIRECIARVKALLRRSQIHQQAPADEKQVAEQLQLSELLLNTATREAILDGVMLELTAREFDLLFYMAENQGRVFSRTQLLDAVWGYSHDGYEHTVNTHINRLRNKLKRNNNRPDFIQTVWGVGYKFTDVSGDQSSDGNQE